MKQLLEKGKISGIKVKRALRILVIHILIAVVLIWVWRCPFYFLFGIRHTQGKDSGKAGQKNRDDLRGSSGRRYDHMLHIPGGSGARSDHGRPGKRITVQII